MGEFSGIPGAADLTSELAFGAQDGHSEVLALVSLIQSCSSSHEVCNYLKKAHIKWKKVDHTDHTMWPIGNSTPVTQLPLGLTSCRIVQRMD